MIPEACSGWTAGLEAHDKEGGETDEGVVRGTEGGKGSGEASPEADGRGHVGKPGLTLEPGPWSADPGARGMAGMEGGGGRRPPAFPKVEVYETFFANSPGALNRMPAWMQTVTR